MFPFSIGGRIKIKDNISSSPQTIEDEIASTLIVKGIAVDYRQDGGISFKLGLFHHFGWTFLLGISSGKICCSELPKTLQITYKLCFLHLSILVSILLIFCKWLELKLSPIHIPAEYYLMVWIWLVCVNILVTRHEFRRFLHKCADESSERVFYWRKQEKAGS